MSAAEDFFDRYRVGITLQEINNFLEAMNKAELTHQTISNFCRSIEWRDIVLKLYIPSTRINPFLQKGVARGRKTARKHYKMPAYFDATPLYYPVGNEEYLWARFIFLVFADRERLELLTKVRWRKSLLPKTSGVFILKLLHEKAKKSLTLREIVQGLGYGRLRGMDTARLRRDFFPLYFKPLIPKFIQGPWKFDISAKYRLSDFGKKCCALAFDKTFQKRYMELGRYRIFV